MSFTAAFFDIIVDNITQFSLKRNFQISIHNKIANNTVLLHMFFVGVFIVVELDVFECLDRFQRLFV
jgi:hypothetical protein